MSTTRDLQPALEPERYELAEPGAYRFHLDRRDFFKFLGAGIIVLLLREDAPAQDSGGRGRRGSGRTLPAEIGAWLHIGEDGIVTVYTGKVEVGQNNRTSLAQAVAEELRTPLSSIRMVMGDTQLCPFDMGTFGSQSTPQMGRQLHRIAAAAREVLIDLAAENWKADRAALKVGDGKVVNPATGDTLAFGALTQGQKLTKAVSENPPVTPAAEWKIAGKPASKLDGRDFVTGKHKYPSDIKLPGMLYGKVLRPPSYGAKLASLDSKAAESMRGVTVVHDGDFVGVTAPSSHQAAQALKALKAEWATAATAVSGTNVYEHLKQTAQDGAQTPAAKNADVALSRSYTVAYIQHVPLEPRAGVAQWEGGKLTVWIGTQRPFGVRGELASAFGIPETDVRVLMPDMGSGYGGKHTGEAALEAARLAKAAGKPVKVTWSREEEFTWAYFRPAGVIEIASGTGKDGLLRAWELHNYNSGASGIKTLYAVPDDVTQFHQTDAPLRQGSYRGLAATANHFARETHIDEIAHELRVDPLEFRLKNVTDPRLRAVAEAAAKEFGWGKQPPANHGYGMGIGFEKGGYIATCAEVAVEPASGRVKVLRTVSAFECGAVVNPDGLKNQVEGAIAMGLGGALFEALEFADGKISNPRLSAYRVPRFSDMPEIKVVLLDRKDLPSAGAGETPLVCIAPAVGNAIFAAGGVRLRSMPLAPGGVVKRT